MQYSVINYKEVKNNKILRFEPEFYCSKIFIGKNFLIGEDIIDFVQYGTSKELNEQKLGYPTLRLNEFDTFFIKEPIKFCDKLDENIYKSLQLRKGDVLICRTNGNPKFVGKSAIVMEDFPYVYASYLFKIRPKTTKINSATLVSYLNSKSGRQEIEKYSMTSNQTNFSPAKFKEINIPIFNQTLLSILDKVITKSYNLLKSAESLYLNAEQLLFLEIGLTDWTPKKNLVFVKNFSLTKKFGRIDAEYFQPKYEEVIDKIKKYKRGFTTLGKIADLKRGSLISDNYYSKDSGTPYIRGADFSSGFLEDDKNVFINNNFKIKAETRVKTGDIVFALIGTVGATALVDEKFNGSFISNNIGKIVVNEYNPAVLQILLHSFVGKLYFEKQQTQTAQPKISDKDVGVFVLPKLDENLVSQIHEKYYTAQKNRELSKALMGISMKGVEVAIEKNEKEAEEWIGEKVKELGVDLEN